MSASPPHTPLSTTVIQAVLLCCGGFGLRVRDTDEVFCPFSSPYATRSFWVEPLFAQPKIENSPLNDISFRLSLNFGTYDLFEK